MSTRPERLEAFREFHKKNPNVYYDLVKLARQAKARGHSKLSIELLFNVLRWEHMINTDDPSSEFKLNNNYKSFYSRMIMFNIPELSEMFDTRSQR